MISLFAALNFLSMIVTSPVHATPENRDFARYDVLAAKFPRAFYDYVERDWLIPLTEPSWREDGASSEMILEAVPTSAGQSNLTKENPRIRAAVVESNGTLTVSTFEFSSWIPPEYGWRIVLAELRLRFPQASKLDFKFAAGWTGPDLGACAERLARGLDPFRAAEDLPLVRAASVFGLLRKGNKAERVHTPNHPSAYHGELVFGLSFEKPTGRN